MTYINISNGELYHHGVVGMHWGVRRYQNADGSLKPAGRKRYTEGGTDSAKTSKGGKKQLTDEERAARNAKIKKAAIAAGAVAATAALAYVGHKYVNHLDSETWDVVKKARNNVVTDLWDSYEEKRSKSNSAKEINKLEWRSIDMRRTVNATADDEDFRRDVAKSIARNDLSYVRDKMLMRNPDRDEYKKRTLDDATVKLAARSTVAQAERIKNAKADKRNYNKALMSYIRSSNPEISRAAKKFQDARSKKLDEIYRAQRNRTIDHKEAANKINELMNLDGAFVRSLERSMKANAKF